MVINDEMAISEHIEEFIQRFFFCLICVSFLTLICFEHVKEIVKVVQAPALEIKFLQFAPGEYFFTSVKIAFFCGVLISSPLIIYQCLLYLIPGLTKKERDIVLPISFGSGLLFFMGLIFSYVLLVPAALNFFICYGSDIVEPFWSFNQYFDFVTVLLFATGLAFQVPAVQILLGLLGIVSGKKMLTVSKYVIVLCTLFAAIITPSTDPITQSVLALALVSLYIGGSGFLIFLKK